MSNAKYKICRKQNEEDTFCEDCIAVVGILTYGDNVLEWRPEQNRNTIIWQDGMKTPSLRAGLHHFVPSGVGLVDPLQSVSFENRLSVKTLDQLFCPPSTISNAEEAEKFFDINYGMKEGDKVIFFNPSLKNHSGFGMNDYFYMKSDVSKLYITETLCLSKDSMTLVSCESPEAVVAGKVFVKEATHKCP